MSEQIIYKLGDKRTVDQKLTEGYISIMTAVQIALEYGHISPKFARVINLLMGQVLFHFKKHIKK